MASIHEQYEAQNIGQAYSEEDPFTTERYEQFFRFLPRGARSVLDVGCNTGRGGARLHELAPRLEIGGLDCVQHRLDALPACYTQKVYGLSTEIPLEDKSLDAIVAGEFIEHIYPNDVDRTLGEFQRVLKVGGRLLMTTPNPRYLKNLLTKLTVYQEPSHVSQHYTDTMRFRLRLHGFARVRVYGSGKVTRYLGVYFPLKMLYGSYLVTGDKI